MYFSELLRRANLNSIHEYLIHGGESFEAASTKTYEERIREARKKAVAFFESRYTEVSEYDEIAGYFNEQAAVFQEVYFEIGLMTGGKIGFELRGKMEELK